MRKSTLNLIHDLIKQYGKYKDDTISINVDDLVYGDKKLLMSHLIDLGDYEWAIGNIYRFFAMYDENKEYLQNALDSECDEVYRRKMEDLRECK
jgi:hypothetical protein